MLLIILLTGLVLAADILFFIKAVDRGKGLALGLAGQTRLISCTACGAINKRQLHAQTCQSCYKSF